jgi:hypothetical protein
VKKKAEYLNGLLFVACFIFGRPLIVLVYTYVEWGRAVKNDMNPDSGYTTVETWSCAYSKESGVGSARSLCTELQTARYLLIPVLVLGAVMLSLVIWKRVTLGKERGVVRKNSAEACMV